MGIKFNTENISEINGILQSEPEIFEDSWLWRLQNPETRQSLVLTLYNNVELGGGSTGSLISVQSQHGYFELHDCTTFMTFEPDEVIFINSGKEEVSCLIIGKDGNCSLFSNINREIINSDFTNLHPAVLLSAMQLSLTENILP
jgi:hypothetical protein